LFNFDFYDNQLRRALTNFIYGEKEWFEEWNILKNHYVFYGYIAATEQIYTIDNDFKAYSTGIPTNADSVKIVEVNEKSSNAMSSITEFEEVNQNPEATIEDKHLKKEAVIKAAEDFSNAWNALKNDEKKDGQ